MRGTRTRRLAIATLTVVASAFALAACGDSGDDNGGTSGGQQKIRLTWQAGYDKPVGALIKAFEAKNPNIKVEANFLPIDSYGQVVTTQFQAGNGPDVVWGSPGRGNTNALGLLFNRGWLAPLNDLSFAKSIPEEASAIVHSGPTLYALPVAVFPIGALYNEKVYDEAKLTTPTTFDQILQVCKTLKDKGKSAIGIPGQVPALFVVGMASNYVYNKIPDWNEQRDTGKVKFATSPEWKETLNAFKTLNDGGCFPKGAAAINIPQAIGRLANGGSLMSIVPGDASAGISAANPKTKLGIFPFPGPTADATHVPISYGQALGLNKSSKHLDAAKKFLEFVAQPEPSKLVAHAMGVPTIDEFKQGQLTPVLAGLQDTVKAKQTTAYGALGFPSGDVYDTVNKATQGILSGQVSVDEALKMIDTAWDSAK
ncbi:MAG TPA: ABC transporter substrate-binding protein [Microbacterium sp.]|uniref:ABC transporter substrate-binding protein n=1 Tax=Microbacterium sp. TaxID=51671 RepID=UPI002CE26A8E|nr:ABC transporter substrate-binding protein [Microbacterium sp.]HWI30570.1 ABC transporter substrate-binding protein [Microbacterium sp.]